MSPFVAASIAIAIVLTGFATADDASSAPRDSYWTGSLGAKRSSRRFAAEESPAAPKSGTSDSTANPPKQNGDEAKIYRGREKPVSPEVSDQVVGANGQPSSEDPGNKSGPTQEEMQQKTLQQREQARVEWEKAQFRKFATEVGLTPDVAMTYRGGMGLQNPSSAADLSRTNQRMGQSAPNNYFGPQYRNWNNQRNAPSAYQGYNFGTTYRQQSGQLPSSVYSPNTYYNPGYNSWNNVSFGNVRPNPFGGWSSSGW